MLEPYYYLLGLLVSLAGVGVLDRRYQLALFFDARRTIKTVSLGVVFFIAWDALGIRAHIFRIGNAPYLTGVRLGHEFPLEELFFLILLVYTALIVWRGSERLWPAT